MSGVHSIYTSPASVCVLLLDSYDLVVGKGNEENKEEKWEEENSYKKKGRTLTVPMWREAIDASRLGTTYRVMRCHGPLRWT